MYVKVKDLPNEIERALSRVGYGRPDIRVATCEALSLSPPSGNGYRGFAVAVALDGSGQIVERWGSWGGANMFSRTIDDATEEVSLPQKTIVIKGLGGGSNPVSATIYAHPSTLAPLLPPAPSIGARDARILYAFRSLKSGPYRNEELKAVRCTDADLDALASKGFVKRSKNGATQITTEGKNALDAVGITLGSSPYSETWIALAKKIGE